MIDGTVKIEYVKAAAKNSLVGGPFGSNLTARDYREDGVPVVRGCNLPMERNFYDDDFVFVSSEKAEELAANIARPGDIVFTQRGTLGQVGIIPYDASYPEYVISQSQMKLTVDPTKADPRFIYYFFRHPNTVAQIRNRAISSGVPHINLGILRDFEIPLPPVTSQSKISDILSAYDDLIENNRRRMELLEASARHLYEEWFVRLRFPGHEHTKIVDGVPEGWEKKCLGECFVLKRGHDLPEHVRVPGDIPVVSSSGITGYHNQKKADGPGVVTGRYGTLGEVHYIDSDYWPHNTALFVSEFKGHSPRVVHACLRYELLRVTAQSNNAAVPGVNRNVIHTFKLVWPSPKFHSLFDDYLVPIYRQLTVLRRQMDTLKTARDLLLPRLMSGEVDV